MATETDGEVTIGTGQSREISGVELFGDYGRTEPVEAGIRIPDRNPNNKTREISGEDLFGDAGKPEVLAMLFKAKAEPKERFAGIKKFIARLKQEFALTSAPWEPKKNNDGKPSSPNRGWVNPGR